MKCPVSESITASNNTTAIPRRKMMHDINNRLNTLHLGITLVSEWDDPELQRLGKILSLEIESLESLLKTALG